LVEVTYTVEVEKNYEPFKNCIMTLSIQRSRIFHNAPDYYLELANKVEKKYNIKCHFTKVDGALVWQYLEFPSEQDYMLWLLKFG
jgi:hypothetical protein